MSLPDRSSWKYEALLLFVVLVWGLNFPTVKAVLAVMPPHALNAFRFVAAALVLGTLHAAEQRRAGRAFFAPLRGHVWPIAGLGLLEFVLYQYCFIVGLDHTAAGNAALIMASSPLWTALIGAALRLESLGRAAWAGLAVLLLGAVVIVLGGEKRVDFGSATFVGNVIMLGAAACWGGYTALSRPVLRHVSAIALTFLALLFALPFLFALALPHFDDVQWSATTPWTWAAIVFSGGISTGYAIALWNRAVHAVGASHTAGFGNLTPLAALFFSYVLLGETVTAVQATGGALIIGGLLWMRRARTRGLPRAA